jgi:hypothetical protein
MIASHDEGSEVAAAEAKRPERHYNDDLQRQLTRDGPLNRQRHDITPAFEAPAACL